MNPFAGQNTQQMLMEAEKEIKKEGGRKRELERKNERKGEREREGGRKRDRKIERERERKKRFYKNR